MSAAALLLLGTMGCQCHSKSDKYYLIAGNMKVPYWKTSTAGFQQAAADYNMTAIVDGPDGEEPAPRRTRFEYRKCTGG